LIQDAERGSETASAGTFTGPTEQEGEATLAIKRITAANENRYNGRSRMEAQHYWAESHGKLVANSPTLRRYHHYFSLYEAYQSEPKPTFIGISMFWRDNPLLVPARSETEMDAFTRFYRAQPLGSDDRQLFDRERRWPTEDQHADILGEEHVIIDGETKASMVNAIFMVCRLPGLDHRDFFDHWLNVHGPIAAQLPGLRRYIQSHVVLESFAQGTSTHDGWSEFWFDDYWSFQQATKSREWAAMEKDGATLFCPEKGIVIGREYVQKDETWKPRDYGALAMTEAEVSARLRREGYKSLASDPAVAARIKAAAARDQIAVWTAEHLAVYGESPIDARPQR
jgi:uncharacterized protein (TIGR02118 family)